MGLAWSRVKVESPLKNHVRSISVSCSLSAESGSSVFGRCDEDTCNFSIYYYHDYVVVNRDKEGKELHACDRAVARKGRGMKRTAQQSSVPTSSPSANLTKLSYAEQLSMVNGEMKCTIDAWKSEQLKLRDQLVVEDAIALGDIRYVGGVDISFPECKEDLVHACACLVVLNYPELDLVYSDCQIVHLTSVYVPEYLAFRECGSLVDLLAKLRIEKPELEPQIILVDGNGVLHPRGFGVASHLGVLLGSPTIGVAKTLFHVDGLENGTSHKEKIQASLRKAGDTFALVGDSGKTHGMALRSTDSSTNPVYVSVGHKVSLQTSVAVTFACCRYRVPEPVRQADVLSREYLRNHYKSHSDACIGYKDLNRFFLQLYACLNV